MPDYLPEAQKAKAESALVLLEVVITEKGKVRDARVLKDPGDGLGKKAIETVKKWEFKPAIGPNGKPVTVKATIEVKFKRP